MEIVDKCQIVGFKTVLPDEVNKLIFKFQKIHPTAEMLKLFIDEYVQYDDEDIIEEWFLRAMLKNSQYWYALTKLCRRCGEAISARDYDNNDHMCFDCFEEAEDMNSDSDSD